MTRKHILRCILTLYLFTAAMPVPVHAAGEGSFIKPYIDALSQLGMKCHIDYWSVMEAQGRSKSLNTGSMAVSDGNYFDSSNSRFVLKNSRWCIVANHEDRVLSVINLDDWQKKMGKEYQLDFSGFLIKDDDLNKLNDLKTEIVDDSMKVTIVKNISNEETITMTLWYAKGSFLPSRYDGVITYFIQDEDDHSPTPKMQVGASVRFHCWNIRRNPAKSLFDDRRIINQTGPKQAYMRRFNDYKMHRSNQK